MLLKKARAKKELLLRKSRRACENSLVEFVKQAWHVVEPGNPYVHGWHIDAICMHLEAVADGEINRLLINVPPGCMKSLLVSVFFPSWQWTRHPTLRFICTSHSQNLALRDSTKMRRLIESDWYQERWGDKVILTSDQNAKSKFENSMFGFREAVAFTSMTGVRGDVVVIDDPHSVDSAASDQMRETTVTTFLEAVPTRLVNPISSAIIVIMQRLQEADVSGVILEKNLGYTHLMLPMEFDSSRKCETEIGFEDPRTEDGELLFEKRFPREVVERDKAVMGPWATAGQFQQAPAPRGGGVIPREYWKLWDDDEARAQGLKSAKQFPPFDYVLASIDTAYGLKEENDFSALTLWGIFQRGGGAAKAILDQTGRRSEFVDERDTLPAAMLMYAWAKKLPIHGPEIFKNPGESEGEFKIRQQQNWGLVEHVIATCETYNVDKLLVESKASGISVGQEIQRLNRNSSWNVELINPGNADKLSRAYAVQPIFAAGQVYAPDKTWADNVISQCEVFPKSAHDDLVDSTTQALRFLRERNFLKRAEDIAADAKWEASQSYRSQSKVVYDV